MRECSDAVQPGLCVAASRNATPSLLGLLLHSAVFARGVLWPVERETVADEPVAEIDLADLQVATVRP